MKHTNPKNNALPHILILGFLTFLSLFLHYRSQERAPEINEVQLKHCLEKGHVRDIVLCPNQKYVKVFIHEKDFHKFAHQAILQHNQGTYTQSSAYYIMKIASVEIFDKHYQSIQRSLDPPRRMAYRIEESSNILGDIAGWINFLLILFFIISLLLRFASRGLMENTPGGGLFGIGKSKAIAWGKERKIGITLQDVAGMVEEKAEIKEIIDCLKNPESVRRLGGRIPKGVLLTGEPGTGKTLLAKAVAGEAGVPFFSVSGSDFVEIFVGVGASRVGDLFEEARKNSPCVIFIDEIDAIGASRSNRKFGGGNEERENTLNKLLTEMDGFGSDDNIVIIAATNRPDTLDSALRRAGRFDTQIDIGYPSIKDRQAIFQHHIQKAELKVVKNLDTAQLAVQTPGFTGADIANTCNQAALMAAREGKKQIHMKHFQEGMDRVTMGLEKKTKVIPPEEKRIVAWHEAGHAVAAWFLEYASPLVKVSIVPRGPSALGYAQYLPKEQAIYQEPQLYDRICVLLAARAAEDITFGKVSTGAADDLQRSTNMAYDLVKKFGMDKTLGHLSFHNAEAYELVPPYSNATSEKIDAAVQKIIKQQYQRAKNILKARKEELKIVAEALIDKEILFRKDLEKLIGKRPSEEETKPKKRTTKLIGPAKKRKT